MGLCGVCNENQHKYKCPKCLIIYCSLSCFKQHKDFCTEPAKCTPDTSTIAVTPTQTTAAATTTDVNTSPHLKITEPLQAKSSLGDDITAETEDKVPLQQLDLLKENSQLRELLFNRHLQEMLKELDSGVDTACRIEEAMQEPLFVEFADECLKTVQP